MAKKDESIDTLKVMFAPLYFTPAGTNIQNTPVGNDEYDSMADDGDGSYGGQMEGISDWRMDTSVKAGDVYQLRFYSQQEIDLIGLFQQGISLAPLGIQSQRTEPSAWGEARMADDYAREYVVWSTAPLSSTDRANLTASFSPTPPYYDGSLHPEQVVYGYATTWTHPNFISSKVGFSTIQNKYNFGFGDMVAAPKLYITRLYIFSGQLEASSGGVPAYLDIPFSCEVMRAVQVEPDDLDYFQQMARSLQPPE